MLTVDHGLGPVRCWLDVSLKLGEIDNDELLNACVTKYYGDQWKTWRSSWLLKRRDGVFGCMSESCTQTHNFLVWIGIMG